VKTFTRSDIYWSLRELTAYLDKPVKNSDVDKALKTLNKLTKKQKEAVLILAQSRYLDGKDAERESENEY
jgi:hypothetical protein